MKVRGKWNNDFCFVVQMPSRVQLFVTPWTSACQVSLSFTISQNLLKFMSTESVMPSNHIILCHPFLFLLSIFPIIRVFFNVLVFSSGGQCIGASASASVPPMHIQSWFILELTGLILLQSRDKSLLQHHSSLALNLFYSPTLTSIHDYWKIIALTR